MQSLAEPRPGALWAGSGQQHDFFSNLFKPARRSFTKAGRLTVRAEVLPLSSKVIDQPVGIELDQSKRNYLHAAAGTPGSDVAAGLFTGRN